MDNLQKISNCTKYFRQALHASLDPRNIEDKLKKLAIKKFKELKEEEDFNINEDSAISFINNFINEEFSKEYTQYIIDELDVDRTLISRLAETAVNTYIEEFSERCRDTLIERFKMTEKSLFEDILQKRGFIVNPQDFNKFESHCIEIRKIVYKSFEDEMERIGIHKSIIWDRLYSFYFGLDLIEILNKILESEDLTEKDLRYFINKNKKAYKVRYFVYHLLFSDLSNYTYIHRKELLNEY